MSDLTPLDPINRFTGLAEIYARNRPGYPDAALVYVMMHCALGPGALLVDVGCGTGIASRQFARRGLRVLGIEPNVEMRARASAEMVPGGRPAPEYRAGQAEATGLPDAVADAVLAAQAFHWFEPEPALREFRRIVKPGGWVVLMWNQRDESDPFTAAYGVATMNEASGVDRIHARKGEVLLASPLFQDAGLERFPHEQWLDEDGLIGRALSVSYAPRDPTRVEAVVASLRALFARYQDDHKVRLRYETRVFSARRPNPAAPARGGL